MAKELIKYDHSYMKFDCPRQEGQKEGRVDFKRLEEVHEELKRQRDAKKISFLELPDFKDEIKQSQELADKLKKKYKTLVVIGVGGSDLGTRTIIRGLKENRDGMDIRFIGANTDPEEISGLLDTVDLKSSVLNIVSKSGGTIEPMSTFLVLRDRLIKEVGVDQHKDQVVATTDPEKGTLREIAERDGYHVLPIPQSIGGRFSALTPVGLFPAACANIPIQGLVKGAKQVFDEFFASDSAEKNNPLVFAGLHYAAYKAGWCNTTVLMPYSAGLEFLGKWFAQLWAESLGKQYDRKGNTVYHGQTPVAALGATDQHSQIQLYNEGPFDKIITFIEVDKCRWDMEVPNPYPDMPDIAYMAGHKFSQIVNYERKATAESMHDNCRPNGTIFIDKITPESVGGLMAFFMLATAVMGELLDINAYDQPGVESGKKIIYKLMGRPGY